MPKLNNNAINFNYQTISSKINNKSNTQGQTMKMLKWSHIISSTPLIVHFKSGIKSATLFIFLITVVCAIRPGRLLLNMPDIFNLQPQISKFPIINRYISCSHLYIQISYYHWPVVHRQCSLKYGYLHCLCSVHTFT